MTTLRELREAAGWSRARLGEAAGVAEVTIRKLEEGYNKPTLETVRKLATVIGDEVYACEFEAVKRPPKRRGRPPMIGRAAQKEE